MDTPAATGTGLLAAAETLAPALAARAAETEALRRLPDASVAALREAGFMAALVPQRFGGRGLGLDDALEFVAALGRGCAATAWVCGLWNDHAVRVGMFSQEAQAEVWSKTPDVPICAGIVPAGRAERVGGGYRLSGRWQFSSGCDHADWALVAAPLSAAGGAPPEPYKFLIRRAEFRIDDTWHVMGLAGTGSKDILVEDVFVPEHRAASLAAINDGRGPGAAFGGPLHRLPITATAPFLLVAPGLGTAEAMLEAFIAEMGTRGARGVALSGLATIQLRLAEAAAEIEAARLLMQRDCREAMRRGASGEAMTMLERTRNRRDMAYAALLCVRAADRLFTALGAAGLHLDNAQQRRFRDIRAVAAHRINSWDIAATTYGQAVFGYDIGLGYA